MIKLVPEQGRAGAGKPATANTKRVLAIRAINIPAPARGTPVAPAPPVAENISLAPALLLILGAAPLAHAPQLINTLAPELTKPVAPAPLAAASTPLVPAPLATSGMAAAANN